MKQKTLLIILVLLGIILFSINSSAISQENLDKFKSPGFTVKKITSEDDYLKIHINWIEDCSNYTVTVRPDWTGKDYTTTADKNERGFKFFTEEKEFIIKSKTSNFEKKYLIKNHKHNFVSNIIHPTTKEMGVEFNTCTNCDAVYKVKDIEKLNNITLKAETGISDGLISWNDAGSVNGYEIWMSKDGKSYTKLATTTSLKGFVTLSNNTYKYKVRGFINNDGEIIYTDFSNIVSLKKETKKINLSVNKKTTNGYKYSLKTYNKVNLKWDIIPDANKYIIYKYNSKTKKYVAYKTITNKSTNTYTVSGLSSSSTYYFKIRAYNSKGKYIQSAKLSVKTLNKTDGYFYDKCIWNSTWDNILVTSEQASNTTMNKYKVNNTKPFVKYNYATGKDTLYIHIYGDFEGPGVNKKFQTYNLKVKNGYHYTLKKTYSTTYKQVVTDTVKNNFNLSIKGNNYDFMTGCNFKTKVVFHTNITDPEQKKTIFKIGKEKVGNDYWFYAEGSSKGDYGVILATQYQLTLNNNIRMPQNDMADYKKTVAHELGHNLGLADAYDYNDGRHKITRTTKNTETGYFIGSRYLSLMYGGGTAKVVKNDIEMMIQAQAESTNAKNVTQYYKTHNTYDQNNKPIKHTKSVVIRK